MAQSKFTGASHDRPAEPVGPDQKNRDKITNGFDPMFVFFPGSSDQSAASRRRATLDLQDPSRNSVFQKPGVEVNQEADAFLRHPQIGDELGFKGWHWPFNALDLNDDEIFHHEIDAILSEKMAFILNWNKFLSLVPQSDLFELDADCRFVQLLQETRPQSTMNGDRASDDCFCQVVSSLPALCLGDSVAYSSL